MNRFPLFKAVVVSLFFATAGVIGYLWYPGHGLPILGVFYATLTVNTFVSMLFYANLFPSLSPLEWACELLLVALYVALAGALNAIPLFEAIALTMFVVATLKYTHLLRRGEHLPTLKKKITIDLLGILLCTLCLIAALCGFALQSAYILTVTFVLANIYLLIVSPMYRVVE